LISSFLFIIFAVGIYGLVHSWLASIKVKQWALDWIGPSRFRWYRLAYNVFSFISLLPVLALAVVLPDRPIFNLPSPWSSVGVLLQLIGAGISIYASVQTGLGRLAGLSQLVEKVDQSSESKLQTDGLYRFVRHPIYSGAILFLWASPQMSWNSLALKIAFTLYFIIGGQVEEKKLVTEFGDAYRLYRLRTPMIVPFTKKPE